jgi:SIR2-like domain
MVDASVNRLSQYIDFITRKKAILFVGAGISKVAGCSTLREICDELETLQKRKEPKFKSDQMRERDIFAYVRSKATSAEEKRQFNAILRRGVTPDPSKVLKKYLPFIKTLKSINPFPPILTTNVDNCLEQTHEFSLAEIFFKPKEMSVSNLKSGGIFHLHGYIEDTSNQTWDLYDFAKLYSITKFRSFLTNLFKNFSVLFMGCGMKDTELLDLLAMANREIKNPITHFALLPEDEFGAFNESFFKETHRVQLINYGAREEFCNIFGSWIDSNFNKTVLGKQKQARNMPDGQ